MEGGNGNEYHCSRCECIIAAHDSISMIHHCLSMIHHCLSMMVSM